VDYSDYEVIVLGCKPSSSAAGFTPLKGYNKPMVLLKPFLLKANVWNWGSPVNTQDLSIRVTDETHPLFRGLSITDGELPLFSQCNTNAVTAISEWSFQAAEGNIQKLGSPVSAASHTTVAELAAGTDCNGMVLPQTMVMIGVSEYSTAFLTQQGKQLIENAILYLLDITMPTGLEQTANRKSLNRKFIHDGQLFIQLGETVYDATGRLVR
jgi:hypothetical protein